MIQSVEDLLRAGPQFHRDLRGRVYSAHLGEEALLYIASHAGPGCTTLEIGGGYSTLVFAMCGAQHTSITTSPSEVDAITAFASANEICLDSVRFIVASSDLALPAIGGESRFDIVLIDGYHAFPFPVLEWHYAGPLIKVGGLLLVDDMEIWAARLLRDFLRQEKSWHYEGSLTVGRTAVFRKIAAQVKPPNWTDQPYVLSRSDLSLMVLRGHAPHTLGVSLPRLARDVAVRAGRTAIGFGRHFRNQDYPPPFR